MLTPNKLVLPFVGAYVCANFGIEMRPWECSQTDRQTDWHTDWQTQTDFLICPMLYAIAMGQEIIHFIPS